MSNVTKSSSGRILLLVLFERYILSKRVYYVLFVKLSSFVAVTRWVIWNLLCPFLLVYWWSALLSILTAFVGKEAARSVFKCGPRRQYRFDRRMAAIKFRSYNATRKTMVDWWWSPVAIVDTRPSISYRSTSNFVEEIWVTPWKQTGQWKLCNQDQRLSMTTILISSIQIQRRFTFIQRNYKLHPIGEWFILETTEPLWLSFW